MNKGNVKWWVLVMVLIILCPSLFFVMVGLNAFFDTSGGSSFVLGVFFLCLSAGLWLLPLGMWRFGNGRFDKLKTGRFPPVAKSGDDESSAGYSPFHTDPHYDADSATQDSGDDF